MGNTIVLVRADDFHKASVAMADLVRYGGMRILGDPRIIPPALSDWAFERISGEKPRKKFRAHVPGGRPCEKSDRQARGHPSARPRPGGSSGYGGMGRNNGHVGDF